MTSIDDPTKPFTEPAGGRIAIVVDGIPIPQGSKTPVFAGHGRRPRMKDANEKRLKPWRRTVRDRAKDVCAYHDTITTPVQVWVRFTFTRPKSHYRTGRNAHRLKDTSPAMPTGHDLGDIDKLQRAIFDALTDAEVWADDSLVVDVRARKFYAGEHELALDRAGVVIILEPLAGPESSVLVPEGEAGASTDHLPAEEGALL